jgi:hypothetical protein
VNGFAWEQRDRAWKTLKAVEEKAVDEIRQHCKLFMEDLEVARCEQTSTLVEAEKRLWRGKLEREVVEQRRRLGVTSLEEPRCSQARRAPFTLAEARVYARQPTTRMQAGGY